MGQFNKKFITAFLTLGALALSSGCANPFNPEPYEGVEEILEAIAGSTAVGGDEEDPGITPKDASRLVTTVKEFMNCQDHEEFMSMLEDALTTSNWERHYFLWISERETKDKKTKWIIYINQLPAHYNAEKREESGPGGGTIDGPGLIGAFEEGPSGQIINAEGHYQYCVAGKDYTNDDDPDSGSPSEKF